MSDRVRSFGLTPTSLSSRSVVLRVLFSIESTSLMLLKASERTAGGRAKALAERLADSLGRPEVWVSRIPANITLQFLPPCSPELNPQENIWDEIREKIFKNYALKSMDKVCDKLKEAALYIERNQKMVKSITSFPYMVRSM
jgi:transposase